jgi:Glycogen recognition site of AMP-activated protein kinase
MAATLLMLAAGSALGAHPVKGDTGIVFTYLAPDAKSVFVAGDFNSWNATGVSLLKKEDGTWIVSVPLEPGTYEYKFIVDDQWVEDPDNPEKKVDPFGGSNSLLVVKDDGSVAVAGAAIAADSPAPAKSVGKITVGPPREVDGGIEFTYKGSSASTVALAGSFNGWNATELPLSPDGQGNWIIVHPLKAGQHEYKLVVDGAWFADPENPDTQADPYGGANSLVTVDEEGHLVAGGGSSDNSSDDHKPNTDLNARIDLGGRYLTRMETVKNVLDDPRYRMQRPTQSVDLNFEAQVSDVAETYMRIRLDSDQNIIQNNIAGFLDEANLVIHPEKFWLKAYLNQETFTFGDLMKVIGNIDLPGTIGHDHLDFGKGTAGAVFEADPFGVHTSAFFANVHDADFYNDPDLFDNTGSDVMGLRFSRKVGKFEFGLPAYMKRELTWLDFNEVVTQTSTGIPILDEHRSTTGDQSTWYETDTYVFQVGLDTRFQLSPKTLLGLQAMYGNDHQRFVTGNESGENNSNGGLDLVFLDRNSLSLRGQVDWNPNDNLDVMVQHTYADYTGANPDQRSIEFQFLPQDLANKNIYFEIGNSPAEIDLNFSELELDYRRGEWDLGLWAWHRNLQYDYSATGTTVPNDSTRTSLDQKLSYISGLVGYGRPEAGLGHGELEFGLNWDDAGEGQPNERSYQLIGRYERNLSRNTAAIADVRYITYHLENQDGTSEPSYWAPFVGLRNRPIRNLELVLGYGVDPVDFSIDYDGRQLGRWWYRQNYLFDNPDATHQDAEDFLANARVITLRAQFIF